MVEAQVKALVFDVFGTVTDWRRSVVEEGQALGQRKGLQVDWERFADEWRREGYQGGIQAVRNGDLPWMNADSLHRRMLDRLLPRHGITGLTESEVAHFNRVWHRLAPWPDAVPGLSRLRQRFVVAPLSNGSFALLTNMAKYAGLPWDCIISAELAGAYKPDPVVYRLAGSLLGLADDEVMLVAAHVSDLRAARGAGLRTAFVSRPREHGEGGHQEPEPDPSFDYTARDFVDLADQLGA